MNVKTMEGLVGAGTNTGLMNTPLRVYEEAERRGDTETMERAMGYAGRLADAAEKYKAEADRGMKEEAKETEEKRKTEREEAIRRRKEEQKKTKEENRENKGTDSRMDTVEISAEGKAAVKDMVNPGQDGTEETGTGTAGVTYTGAGEPVHPEQSAVFSVSV